MGHVFIGLFYEMIINFLVHCQVNFINLDWWFRAGNSDTCIAEILADTSIGTTCFNTKTKCRLFT
jgi:hypothetical protein